MTRARSRIRDSRCCGPALSAMGAFRSTMDRKAPSRGLRCGREAPTQAVSVSASPSAGSPIGSSSQAVAIAPCRRRCDGARRSARGAGRRRRTADRRRARRRRARACPARRSPPRHRSGGRCRWRRRRGRSARRGRALSASALAGRVEEAGADARHQQAREQGRPRRVDPANSISASPAPTSASPMLASFAGESVRPELGGHPRDDEDEERPGQVDEPGLDRRHAEDRLQVERDVEEDREERGRDREDGDLRAREPAVAHQPQRQHRLARALLDDHEGDQQHRGAGERGDDPGAPPALLVAAQQARTSRNRPPIRVSWPGRSMRRGVGSRPSAT